MDKIVAVKKIKKDLLAKKKQIIHVRNEQLFMSKVKSPWIVELKASFQEDDYLDGIFTWGRFYEFTY